MSGAKQTTAGREALLARYARCFGEARLNGLAASGRMLIERDADGAWITDIQGRRYLDFFLASGVFNVGHRNARLRAALDAALEDVEFGGVFYLSEARLELAEHLSRTTPDGLEVVLPAVGGGEAIDLALKLAMANTGRTRVVCGESSYHGSTGLSAELGPERLRTWYPLEPLPVCRVPVGDVAALRAAVDERTAACVLEPIRSLVDGRRPGPEYWREARRICDSCGALLIIDEVVCGMGRLGALWGSDVFGIEPDMLVTAKGLSGGVFPMAALVCRPGVVRPWGDAPYLAYSTYAWSNVGARVASAALDEVARLLPDARRQGDALDEGLRALLATHGDTLVDVRRTGLHWVLDFNPDVTTGSAITDALFERGVLIHASGAYPDAPAKLMPPLVLDDEQIGTFLDRADDALAGAKRRSTA